ncbi:uncharacterized protein LOC125955454 [Anopheles darlingi]|uniref:uncharacterized protein LOC125955454 n=1 Tax=Anopheles darlingi TaxID=43151 RepID=UPI002100127A|nr:uncharacterized protein LOC125955454 [Anopheles darlingi]
MDQKSHKESEKQFIKEFIQLYRECPEVWKVKSDGYKDRNKRDQAYLKLVNKMKEFDPCADKNTVSTKLNSLRSTYRRELKKVRDSMRSGIGSDEVYVPSLWYYNDLDFLQEQENQAPGVTTLEDYREENQEEEVFSEIDEPSRSSLPLSLPASSRKRPAKKGGIEEIQEKQTKFMELAYERPKSPTAPTDVQITANAWAVDLAKMQPDHQAIAKACIQEILSEGLMGGLSRKCMTLNCQPQVVHHPIPYIHPSYNYMPHQVQFPNVPTIVPSPASSITSQSSNTMLNTPSNSSRTMDDLKKFLKSYEEMRPVIARPTAKPAPIPDHSKIRTNEEQPRCYNCSKMGHYKSACPMPPRPNGSCFKCHRMGHTYRTCPNPAVTAVTAAAVCDAAVPDAAVHDVALHEVQQEAR